MSTDRIIPNEIATDRAVRSLLTQWRNCHLRYRECCKRVNWKNAKARKIEKQRRREKWQQVARILEIERTLIRWTAKATHHPEIWMSRKVDSPESTRIQLIRRYHRNIRSTHNLTGPERQKRMRQRATIVRAIRELERSWLVALYSAVFPDQHPPKPLPLHPRELRPRKLTVASKILSQELAA
jgi:hypothetical protein